LSTCKKKKKDHICREKIVDPFRWRTGEGRGGRHGAKKKKKERICVFVGLPGQQGHRHRHLREKKDLKGKKSSAASLCRRRRALKRESHPVVVEGEFLQGGRPPAAFKKGSGENREIKLPNGGLKGPQGKRAVRYGKKGKGKNVFPKKKKKHVVCNHRIGCRHPSRKWEVSDVRRKKMVPKMRGEKTATGFHLMKGEKRTGRREKKPGV